VEILWLTSRKCQIPTNVTDTDPSDFRNRPEDGIPNLGACAPVHGAREGTQRFDYRGWRWKLLDNEQITGVCNSRDIDPFLSLPKVLNNDLNSRPEHHWPYHRCWLDGNFGVLTTCLTCWQVSTTTVSATKTTRAMRLAVSRADFPRVTRVGGPHVLWWLWVLVPRQVPELTCTSWAEWACLSWSGVWSAMVRITHHIYNIVRQ
jgi:hypothetical protein